MERPNNLAPQNSPPVNQQSPPFNQQSPQNRDDTEIMMVTAPVNNGNCFFKFTKTSFLIVIIILLLILGLILIINDVPEL